MDDLLKLIGRILLSAIFIAAGVQKYFGYDGTLAYMAKYGVTGALLPAVIAIEFFGGLAILFGIGARLSALALAGFTIVAALLFHRDFSDPMMIAMFMKNLAISGGLLLLFVSGPGRFAIRD